jgi:hypothetical protein
MKHNVFISWSGKRALKLATALRQFIQDVIQHARPWMSSEDIDKGKRWNLDVAKMLRDAKIGVACVTPENMLAPWILFEAGALAKTLDDAYVCCYLLDLQKRDLKAPLADLQATTADREDTFKLMQTLNRALGRKVDEARLGKAFNFYWPELEKTIAELIAVGSPAETAPAHRSTDEVLDELVGLVRDVSRRVSNASAFGFFSREEMEAAEPDWQADVVGVKGMEPVQVLADSLEIIRVSVVDGQDIYFYGEEDRDRVCTGAPIMNQLKESDVGREILVDGKVLKVASHGGSAVVTATEPGI